MKKIVYYGDSITEGFVNLKKYDNVVNLGVSGDKTTDLISRFFSVIREQPKRLIMMIGTNDYLVKQHLWQEYISIDFEALYYALLTLIRDNLNTNDVILLSVLPVSVGDVDLKQYNSDIDEYNKYIKEKANEFGYTYIDLNKHFKNDGGVLNYDVTSDGVHLNELGYELYHNLIKEYLK